MGCRLIAGAAFLGAAAYSDVRAELLSDYFPDGVPGYGTAPGVTVASRARPDFDPLGVRFGDFLLHPAWQQDVGYDDNVLAGTQPRQGSWVVGSHPSLLLNSDWSRDNFGAYLGADDQRYLNQPHQSYTNWTASLGGGIAVGRDRLTLSYAHLDLHEARSDLDALPSDTPIGFRVNDVRASYSVALDRLSITPALSFSAWRYDNTTIFGLPASQTYRDRNVLQGNVTTRYELWPRKNLLFVMRALGENFVAPQPGAPTRNSTGYQVLVGMDDGDDAMWRYRVLLGWEDRIFQAPQYRAHQAPIAEVALTWNPSGLTTVTAKLTRAIEDAAQEGIAGYTYTSARLVIDHEYLRNVLLRASAGVQHADYLPGGGSANAFALGGGVTWLINRNMRLSATYDFTDQHGSASPTLLTVGSYTRSVGLLTLRFGM